MLKKNYSKSKTKCRVTFKYPNPEDAATAVLAGEFNGWSITETPMKKLKNGSFSVTVSLDSGSSYSYRYVLNDTDWVNDPEADKYMANEHGGDNSVVVV